MKTYFLGIRRSEKLGRRYYLQIRSHIDGLSPNLLEYLGEYRITIKIIKEITLPIIRDRLALQYGEPVRVFLDRDLA